MDNGRALADVGLLHVSMLENVTQLPVTYTTFVTHAQLWTA